jgi:hypothetical protein
MNSDGFVDVLAFRVREGILMNRNVARFMTSFEWTAESLAAD